MPAWSRVRQRLDDFVSRLGGADAPRDGAADRFPPDSTRLEGVAVAPATDHSTGPTRSTSDPTPPTTTAAPTSGAAPIVSFATETGQPTLEPFAASGSGPMSSSGGSPIPIPMPMPMGAQDAVAALERLSRQHERILNAAGEGIYEIDERGRTRFVNPAAARLLGWEASALIGRPVHDVLHRGQQVDEDICPIHTALIDGVDSYVKDDRFSTRDDGTIPVEYICTPIIEQDPGVAVGAVITFQNIAERRLIESEIVRLRDMALESARLRSEFLANMSHEIRTPLNGIIGMTGILLDTDLTSEQRRSAAIIKASADALLTIVNDILDFARVESGKMRFETLDFDLLDVIESTTESFAERAHAKGVELVSWVASDVPTGVRGDPGRLRQVLTNLLGNALKFTERGEVVLRATKELATVPAVSAGPGASTAAGTAASTGAGETGVILRIEIRDTGIGITPVQQAHLFQPFVQADSSTTRVYGGTGLGLAISRQIVEQMGGTIGVDSELGRGARFWFTLKLGLQPPVARLPQHARLAGIRALIVEDNETCADFLHQQLADHGAACVEVDQTEEAVRELRRAAAAGTPYDLVLLDHGLMGPRGIALGREIQSDPTLTTRLLLLTPTATSGDVAHLTPARGVAALHKPIKQLQLVSEVSTLLATRRPRRAAAAASAASSAAVSSSGVAPPPMSAAPAIEASSPAAASAPAAAPKEQTAAPPTIARDSDRTPPGAHAGAPGGSAAAPQMPSRLTPHPARRPRILVAEDNVVNQQVALQQLHKLGYTADAVANGHEALEALTRIRYDLVLMDCQMPDLDGYEATRELRRREGAGRHTPVIAMTAYALPSDRQLCLEAGMDDYVAKPVTLDHLKTIVHTYLRQPAEDEGERPAPLPPALVGVIDAAMWQSLHAIQSEHGGDFVHATIVLYLEYATSCIETLRSALAAGDLQALARAAHSLKGSSSILGLSTIANLSAELTQTGRQDAPLEALRILQRLELEFQRVKAAVESQLSASGPSGMAERRK